MTQQPHAAPGEVGSQQATGALLEVSDLEVAFRGADGWVPVVEDVSFTVAPGEVLGLVGESGSGKTVTSLALMGLVPWFGGRVRGSVRLEGRDLLTLGERAWSDIRGDEMTMIFQQPVRSLNPAYTVGDQIAEVVRRHEGGSRRQAWQRTVEMLERVGIPDAGRRAREYPHTFSGGMCQRVMIAMALICRPKLLIADEPTTALDVTVQARVLALLRELATEFDVAILFITHDLGVIAEMCHHVEVMYAGRIVEEAPVEQLFTEPVHPYTEGLLGSIPRPGLGRELVQIPGSVPAPSELPQACRFHPRCPYRETGRCDVIDPELAVLADGRRSRCLRVAELSLKGVDVDRA